MLASTATRWVWATEWRRHPTRLQALTRELDGVGSIAVGPTADGLDGFRRGHFDPITTQRPMARLHSTNRSRSSPTSNWSH